MGLFKPILLLAVHKHLNVFKTKLLRFAVRIRNIQHRRHLYFLVLFGQKIFCTGHQIQKPIFTPIIFLSIFFHLLTSPSILMDTKQWVRALLLLRIFEPFIFICIIPLKTFIFIIIIPMTTIIIIIVIILHIYPLP